MTAKPSLTIIVPAYMEAKNIRATIADVVLAVNSVGLVDYEILIIDCLNKKGEDDGTPQIAEELAKTNPRIRAIHNPYVSLSYKYWQGVGLARYEYVTWVPGDNVIELESLKAIFRAVGQTDIVSCYIANPAARPLKRRIISKLYNFFVNTLFGLHLRYFNSVAVYKTETLRQLPQVAKANAGFSWPAEILIRLIKADHSYVEVPHDIKPDPKKDKAAGFGNFWRRYSPLNTIKTLLKLSWELRVKKKKPGKQN